jgi:hypothetical protein
LELNIVNSAFGLKDVSLSNLSKIRKLKFPKYDAKKPGNNFARRSTCDRLNLFRKATFFRSEATMLWAQKFKFHLDSVWVHRMLYYTNRYHLQFFPGECVMIIHDKMDHPRIATPVFLHNTK